MPIALLLASLNLSILVSTLISLTRADVGHVNEHLHLGNSYVARVQNLYTLSLGQLLAKGFRHENHQPILRPQSASHLLS